MGLVASCFIGNLFGVNWDDDFWAGSFFFFLGWKLRDWLVFSI